MLFYGDRIRLRKLASEDVSIYHKWRNDIEVMHFTNPSFSMVDLNFSKDLIGISCDTLIVCGEKDHANRNASKNLLELIPKSKIQLITNAAHEINVQNPQKLAETLETFYENPRLHI